MSQPFRSVAQRDKWKELVGEGKVSKGQYDARDALTNDNSLPARAEPRKRTAGPSRSAAAAKFNDRLY